MDPVQLLPAEVQAQDLLALVLPLDHLMHGQAVGLTQGVVEGVVVGRVLAGAVGTRN